MNGFTLVSPKNKTYFFQPNDLLGTGSFGDVYKGKNTDTNEVVAIKRVQNSVLEKYGEEFKKCLGDEANLLLQMNLSDKTVQILDCFATQHHVCIIMEFCDGGTLEKLISKNYGGKLDEDVAINYFYQICVGLYGMHTQGMMHRDLKLENIFMKKGLCKIGDFGFATRNETSDQYVGSPEYMAPEIFDIGDGVPYNKQVDIWALGIMLHEMLFGNRPFTGSQTQLPGTIKNTVYKVPDNPKTSDTLKDLLYKMLQKDPKKRITIEQIMKHKIFAKFEEEKCNSTNSSDSKSLGSSSTYDQFDSQNLRQSVVKELNEKRVQRIVKKLDNFRQSCKFFMTLLTNWSSYMKPSSPDDFILDEFHPLSHYCLKYAAFNFGFLLDILSSRECPKQMIATYDHDYWDNFLDTPEYVDLAKKTEDLKNQATKILTTFTEQNLAGYLTRKQKKLSDMKSVYNTDLTLDCSASLQGKLHEASLIIQKISSSKKKYFDELQKISVDLEFAKKILDDAYDNKTIILFEDYAKQRGNKDIKLSSFFTELPYLQ